MPKDSQTDNKNARKEKVFGSEETNRQMSGEYDQNQPEKKKPLPKLFQPL